MNAAIIWNFPALARFYALGMAAAAEVDRAVIRFAATGEGQLAWDPPYHRLRAGQHDVMLAIDLGARTVTVMRIYRAR